MKPVILILCTGNSCRSQMAEGFLRQRVGERYQVLSAGTEPKDYVHPLAVQVMQEKGVDISDQHPKLLQQFLGQTPVWQLLIVCSDADEKCPRVWPGLQNRGFWPFDDPAAFVGTPEATLDEFRRVRDQIEQTVDHWIAQGLPVIRQ